jgi:2',3'-cyclic-nucleotide 2'-phosphodiesterase
LSGSHRVFCVKNTITALLLGDIVGQPGCRALFVGLQSLTKRYAADLVVVNGENAAQGFGITPEVVERLLALGVHVITSGNHVWQKRELWPLLDSEPRLLRPANYPPGVPGHGYVVQNVKGSPVAVVNLQGRMRMSDLDCPFQAAKDLLRKIARETRLVIVDFHAEVPEEKEALAMYLDGQVSFVYGTHTHVQTADERILPKGTAFMTDLGMTGPVDSVIGVRVDIAVRRSLTQLPLKMEVADGAACIQGAVVSIDTETGTATHIARVSEASTV